MKCNPRVLDKIELDYLDFHVKLCLNENLILLGGDSGVGKTCLFNILSKSQSIFEGKVLCIDWNTIDRGYKLEDIFNFRGKLIVIDNADTLLSDDIREKIRLDMYNQYLILGRDPRFLPISVNNYYELHSSTKDLITTIEIIPIFKD